MSTTEEHPLNLAAYPAEQAVDVALRDGSTVHVRPVRPTDRDAILRFLSGLSEDSLYMRGCGIPNVQMLSSWSVDIDYADRYGVIVTRGPEHEIVGHGAYVGTGGGRAEIAFEVADALQGLGIATVMLGHLAGVAAQHEINEFTAEVMPSNQRMLATLHSSGFPVQETFNEGLTEVRMPTQVTPEALAAFAGRSHTAAVAALRHVLEPQRIAVIGASERPDTIGGTVTHNLSGCGFSGRVYPVNPRHATTWGVRTYPSIATAPMPVDLAVVAVPASQVPLVARECAEAGVRSLTVLTAGFSDGGSEGHDRARELIEICRDSGMRLVGPASAGILSQTDETSLNATAVTAVPRAGKVGLMAQSGGIGAALLDAARNRGLGIARFVSVGDKADISGNDLLEYLEQDPATRVIALYLQSFGNPHRFARIARRVAARKPILVVKSGDENLIRQPGATGPAASMASHVTTDALFRQAGIIRAGTIRELLDIAALLEAQPAPAGRRVAIVANGHGAAQVASDACRAQGLVVTELSEQTTRRLQHYLPSHAMRDNPVDLTREASPSEFRTAVSLLAGSGECDAIIAVIVPSPVRDSGRMAAAIDAGARQAGDVSVAAVLMDGEMGRNVPFKESAARFSFPDDAAAAIAATASWSAWRAEAQEDSETVGGCDVARARALVRGALADGEHRLAPAQARELLDCYGINGAELPADRERAPDGNSVIGPRQDQPLPLLSVGITQDSSFGPVIMCGAADPRWRHRDSIVTGIAPLRPADTRRMVSALLDLALDPAGHATATQARAQLEQLLLRLSALAQAHPEISELELSPVTIDVSGARFGAAELQLSEPLPQRPIGWLRR